MNDEWYRQERSLVVGLSQAYVARPVAGDFASWWVLLSWGPNPLARAEALCHF